MDRAAKLAARITMNGWKVVFSWSRIRKAPVPWVMTRDWRSGDTTLRTRVSPTTRSNNIGEAIAAKGTVDGDTLGWTNEAKMGGKVVKGQDNIKRISPTSYTFKLAHASARA